MGLLSNLFSTIRMVEYYAPSIKKTVDKALNAYTNTISPETWTEKVADVDTSDMSYAEKLEAKQLAEQYAELAAGQCDNLKEAIANDPVSWGAYLQEKGVDSEKIEELETKVKEDGQIPPLELVQLTLDGTPIDDAKGAVKDAVNDLVAGGSGSEPTEEPAAAQPTEAPDYGEQAISALSAVAGNVVGAIGGAAQEVSSTEYEAG